MRRSKPDPRRYALRPRAAKALWLAFCFFVAAPFVACAREAPPVGKDPVIEQRMMKLADELRCLVCQNQTLADSKADLAEDLRQEIRELMQKGQSDEEVKRYLVARYGDFVLYRPPMRSATWLLWFGPAVLLVAGLTTLYLVLLRRRRLAADEPLNADQEQRALALLSEEEGRLS
jgi:cytochrome c-type biogenesis protein CcmH